MEAKSIKSVVVNASIPSVKFELLEEDGEVYVEVTQYFKSMFALEALGKSSKVRLSKLEAEQLLVFLHSAVRGTWKA